MKVVRSDETHNRHFKHFRVCGPISLRGINYVYAIPKTLWAERILSKRGYEKKLGIIGIIFRKVVLKLDNMK